MHDGTVVLLSISTYYDIYSLLFLSSLTIPIHIAVCSHICALASEDLDYLTTIKRTKRDPSGI